ncbi:MAG: hypothetical protein P4L53_15535 [Candidatus Obscuribacterales bacterium]|nr:hypothetical protein [Candidatus Obscuribacterales bacterium]
MRLYVQTICLVLALSLPLSVHGQSDTDTTNSFNITDPSQATDPIAKLELRIFDHTYKADSQEARIKRLENFVFGAAQTGDTQSRLSKLQESVTASSASSSSPTAEDSGGSQKGSEPTAAAKPTFDEADYPRVDQLERQILGQQHSHEILSGRLSRLEAKAFGKPSASTDPADRVDALDAYVARHDIYGGQGNSNVGQTVPFTPYSAAYPPANPAAPSYSSAPSSAYQGTPYQSPYGTGSNSSYGQASAPPVNNPYLQANVTSTNDRLASMEKTEFGRDYPTHSLKDRVQRLEKKIDPGKKGQEAQSLPARVDQLWAVVSVSNSIGNSPIASSAGKANDYYSSNNQQGNNSNKPHHSLLHSVGKVLGAAAVTAGSAGMMMGGMGMSGMGGMGGYGMSRYGMGGYGMSPYSMGGYNGGYGSGYSNYGGYGSGYGGYNNSYGLGRF